MDPSEHTRDMNGALLLSYVHLSDKHTHIQHFACPPAVRVLLHAIDGMDRLIGWQGPDNRPRTNTNRQTTSRMAQKVKCALVGRGDDSNGMFGPSVTSLCKLPGFSANGHYLLVFHA